MSFSAQWTDHSPPPNASIDQCGSHLLTDRPWSRGKRRREGPEDMPVAKRPKGALFEKAPPTRGAVVYSSKGVKRTAAVAVCTLGVVETTLFNYENSLKKIFPDFGITLPPESELSVSDVCNRRLSERVFTIFSILKASLIVSESEREVLLKQEDQGFFTNVSFDKVWKDPSVYHKLLIASRRLSLISLFWEGRNGYTGRSLCEGRSLEEKVSCIWMWQKGGGENVQRLDGRGCGMTCVPREVWRFNKLQELLLDCNPIVALSDDITPPACLKKISFLGCPIFPLPRWVANFSPRVSPRALLHPRKPKS